jgi:RNA polymerase sigma-70 factor (ECF subfamily)
MSDILEKKINSFLATDDYEQAFAVIISGYKERLYWHIRNMILSHTDTDDILQNTYIKIWRYLPKFEGRSQVFSWVYRIATNETLSFIEKNKKNRAISIDDIEGHVANYLMADPYFDGNQVQAILHEAVKALPEKQQLVFNMKYFQDMKYQEISDVLETSVGGLKASYHHAVKKIEEYVKIKTS